MYRFKRLAVCAIALLTVFACGCSLLEPFIPDLSGSQASGESSYTESQSISIGETSSEPQYGTSGETEILLPEDTVVSVLACGDNLIHPSVYYTAMEYYAEANGSGTDYKATNDADYDFLPIYEHVADTMKNADICYVNQETLSGGEGTTISGYPMFNSPLAVGATLAELGVDVINMAHNHMLDAGNDSFLKYSDGYFTSLGMTPLGYYENEEATDEIVLYTEQGITFAFLTYTYSTNGLVCYSETYIPYFEEDLIRRQVALAKEQADVVIVSAHWGNEDQYSPTSTQTYYAELFCELGVDVVIGMHSHCLQPMQWMTDETTGHEMLLTYSIGNFVSGMVGGLNVLEGMLSFDVRKDAESGEITVENPLFTPLVLHYEKENAVASNDTGYRNFKIYELKDYTEELAASHGVVWYEKRHSVSTLYGGGFSRENLYTTLKKIIPAEFLSAEYR